MSTGGHASCHGKARCPVDKSSQQIALWHGMKRTVHSSRISRHCSPASRHIVVYLLPSSTDTCAHAAACEPRIGGAASILCAVLTQHGHEQGCSQGAAAPTQGAVNAAPHWCPLSHGHASCSTGRAAS